MVPSVPKLSHYSNLFLTINFGRRSVKITAQKLSWIHFLGAVILTGSDFHTVSAGDFGLWEINF